MVPLCYRRLIAAIIAISSSAYGVEATSNTLSVSPSFAPASATRGALTDGTPPAQAQRAKLFDPDFIETLTKTFVAIVSSAWAVVQAYKRGWISFQSRANLKRDLELLKMLDPTDRNYTILKAHIDRVIESFYSPSPPPPWKRLAASTKTRLQAYLKSFTPKDKLQFAVGLVFLLLFSFVTAYVNRDGFSWWSLVPGFLAFLGFGFMLISYEESDRPKLGMLESSGATVAEPPSSASGDK